MRHVIGRLVADLHQSGSRWWSVRRSVRWSVSRQYGRKVDLGAAYAVFYDRHGDPEKVLEKRTIKLSSVRSGEVVVRMLAAPVNPADINLIQGTYGVTEALPAVGGVEGVGQVIECGEGVTRLKSGDWVIPTGASWGTWRTHVVSKVDELRQVANDIPLVSAATLSVNPCTAYRLLHDFAQLDPGDLIIQNCATSGVGRAVIQIADTLGLTTVNIVRRRADMTPVTATLKDLGASYVVDDEFATSRRFREFVKDHPAPKLALNGAGGATALAMTRALRPGGTIVTYGGMSKQPVTVPTSALIFNDVRVVGFWRTRWAQQHRGDLQDQHMWSDLVKWIKEGRLQPPDVNLVPLSRYEEAVHLAVTGNTGKKQVIFMEQYDSD